MNGKLELNAGTDAARRPIKLIICDDSFRRDYIEMHAVTYEGGEELWDQYVGRIKRSELLLAAKIFAEE